MIASSRRFVSLDEVLESVKKYGKNSNAFMTLYSNYEYFASSKIEIPGIIAFLNLSHTWVGGAEPLAEPQHQSALLAEFAKAAAEENKAVVLIPVGNDIAQRATEAGYGSIFIGTEPTFDLSRYPRTGKTWIDIVSTAKQLHAKGARFFEFNTANGSNDKKKEFESITRSWLNSRKMPPLGFLNRVEPWTLSEYKRYFYLELNGQVLAFLAAIPIFARNGWYLIDLLKKDQTPAGTTELLSLLAMRTLSQLGAKDITFGVSPLSQIDQVQLFPFANTGKHPWLYSFLQILYKNGNSLYSFKNLYQFKLKFEPSTCPPAYLVYKDSRTPKEALRLRTVINVFEAFLGQSLFRATLSALYRSIKAIQPSELIKTQIHDSVVVRSAPKSWRHLLYRCRLTALLSALQIIIYIFTVDSSAHLRSSIESQWGYNWTTFLNSPIRALIFSPFLHLNLLHLTTNIIMMVLFTGGLEYLAGTGITALCYAFPMVLSNPLTSAILIPLHMTTPNEIDVGASLGIFGCLGSVSLFLTKGKFLILSFMIGIFLFSYWTDSWLSLNHLTAIFIGVVAGTIVLKK